MKILALSFLRLGDLIMQRKILREIKIRHPGCELHVAIHETSAGAIEVLTEVDFWIVVDRGDLQKKMSQVATPLFRPFVDLALMVRHLEDEKYDMVVNLTHNLFSAHVASSLRAGHPCLQVRGLAFTDRVQVRWQNLWIKYFNNEWSLEQRSFFHYIEALSQSVQFELSPQSWFRPPFSQQKSLILFQLRTSDEKKNISLEKIKPVILETQEKYGQENVLLLATGADIGIYRTEFPETEVYVGSLREIEILLEQARLLITTDTSIMHLAAEVGTPILEIALGSANFYKTGPFSANAAILKSSVGCFPCRPSQACSQTSHLCEQEVSISSILRSVDGLLANGEVGSNVLKTTFQDGMWGLLSKDERGYFEIKKQRMEILRGGQNVARSREVFQGSP